jgi:phasin family protein
MWKANVLFDIVARATHDLWTLNLRTTAAAASDFSAITGQLLTSRDPAQALAMLADLGEPATEKMLAYVIRAKEVMTAAKNGIAAIADPFPTVE